MTGNVLTEDFTEKVGGGRHADGPPASGDGAGGHLNPQPLFRKEAVSSAGSGVFGKPIARLPVSWRVLTLLLVLMAGLGAAILFSSSYERRETARGILRAKTGEARIHVPQSGTITAMEVSEGDVVEKGDVLLFVSTDRSDAIGTIPYAAMIETLAQQEQSVLRRLAAIGSSDGLLDSAAAAELEGLHAALGAARADLVSTSAQFAMAEQDYARALPISQRGFISLNDMRRREQAVIIGRQALANAEAAIARLEAQIVAHRANAARRPHSSEREQGDLLDLLADIEQRRSQYAMGRGFAVRAPISGTVTALQGAIGHAVDSSRPVMTVMPERAELIAVLYVPSRGIGFLEEGQEVRLRYDAFPFGRFGAAKGTVDSISETVLRPEDVDAAIRLEEPAYRVVVRLARQEMDAFGRSHPLHPGLALTADVVAEERSFAAWIFEPLLALGAR